VSDRKVTIAGMDPGLAHFGVAILELDKRRKFKPAIVTFLVHETRKEKHGHGISASEDLVMRGDSLALFLQHIQPDAFCVEAMSFPRSSSNAAKLALAWGVLVMHARQRRTPILCASPQRVRDAVVGKRIVAGKRMPVTKGEVESAVLRRTGMLVHGANASLMAIAAANREHAWDAAAAALALLDSPVIESLLGPVV
jgi:Holliday junction resolvasome RuvABC endonuclease subunit